MVTIHNLGFPRIGAKRELKSALEAYWKGASPREELKTLGAQLRERPHDMIAVFSVTATGMLWLLLSMVLRRSELYYPYTLAYSANLCFIGITWYRNMRRSASLFGAVGVSALVAWAAFFVPYVAVVGLTEISVLESSLGLVPLLLGGLAFSIAVPDDRRRPSAEYPWTTQALVGLASSALGLALLVRLPVLE